MISPPSAAAVHAAHPQTVVAPPFSAAAFDLLRSSGAAGISGKKRKLDDALPAMSGEVGGSNSDQEKSHTKNFLYPAFRKTQLQRNILSLGLKNKNLIAL